MLKKLLIFFALLIFIQNAFSQNLIAEFNLLSNWAKDIQFLNAGDSVFLMYNDKKSQTAQPIKKGYWLKFNGEFKSTSVDQFGNVTLFGISKFQGETYYYYFDESQKKPLIKALVQKPEGSDITKLDDKIEITGTLLGVCIDGDLFVLSYEKEKGLLHVLQINKVQRIKEIQYQIPFDLKDSYKKNSGFITKNQLTSVEQGTAKFKAYKYPNYIAITTDHEEMSFKGTRIIYLDLKQNQHEFYEIPVRVKSNVEFKSFLFDDKLYRATISNKVAELNVFDIKSSKELLTRTFENNSFAKEQHIYARAGKTREVSNKGTVSGMMRSSAATTPSIVVDTGNDSLQFNIVYGSFYEEKGVGSVGSVANPIAMLLTFAVSTAVRRIDEGPGVSLYFYITPSTYTIQNDFNPEPVRKKIDDYEISRKAEKKDLHVVFKGYVSHGSKALGIYHDNSTKSLRIVKFE